METIWKFPLEVADTQYIEVPRGARFLSVNTQRGTPCIWAQVDTDKPQDSVLVVIHGTGHNVKKPDMKFVGTFMLHDGAFVGHVFVIP